MTEPSFLALEGIEELLDTFAGAETLAGVKPAPPPEGETAARRSRAAGPSRSAPSAKRRLRRRVEHGHLDLPVADEFRTFAADQLRGSRRRRRGRIP